MIEMNQPTAPEQTAPQGLAENDEQVIQHLAELPLFEYDRVRKEEAKRLGVRTDTLDQTVQSFRADTSSDDIAGEEIIFSDIKPWPDPVDGVELLNEIAETIGSHMAMPEHSIYATVLWCVHTHCFERFNYTPRLAITAPAKECGKTVLLTNIVGNLVPKAMPTDNMSPAVYYRLVSAHKPTFLIDEVDAWLREDSALRSSLNGGFEPKGGTLRCEGDGNDVRLFSTFAPTAMAGINILPKLGDPIVSRSIVITLQRAGAGEVKNPFNKKHHQAKIERLCRRLARFVADNIERISATNPDVPDGVMNRLEDKWSPLLAIAEVVGGPWPDHARKALFSDNDGTSASNDEQLLIDIGAVLSRFPAEKNIFTSTLISALCEPVDNPYSEYNFKDYGEEKKIKPRQLANKLKPYGVRSKSVRSGEQNQKGYAIADLQNAVSRYAPPLVSVTASQVNDTNGFSDSLSVTEKNHVTDKNPLKANDTNGCDAVTDRTEGVRGDKHFGREYDLWSQSWEDTQ